MFFTAPPHPLVIDTTGRDKLNACAMDKQSISPSVIISGASHFLFGSHTHCP